MSRAVAIPEYLLREVAEGVFLTEAFMFLLSDEPPAEMPEYFPHSRAIIEFQGARTGMLVLGLDPGVNHELAANMLGIADEHGDPEAEQREDSLRELLNVICGNLLPALAEPEAVFDPKPPRKVDPQEYGDLVGPLGRCGHTVLQLDSGLAELELYLD